MNYRALSRCCIRSFLVLLLFTLFPYPAIGYGGAGAFDPVERPIALKGVSTSIRTVWFSPDGKQVYGDFDHLVKWELRSGRVLSTLLIPGHNVHPSLLSSDGTMWVQAVRGYDNPARPDIYKTHPALVYGSPKGPLTLKKTGSASLGKGVFLPGTRQAVFIVSDKRRRYSVRSYDVARNKLSTTYVRPAKARRRVPTDLAVSKDGKILAVGLGGKESGTVFYDVETGAKLGSHATGSEVTSVSFVGQELLFSDLDGRIYRWKLGNKKERSARLLMKSRVRILTMAVHPSGASAIIGGMSGVHLVDLHNKKVRRKLLRSRAIDIRFSDDGNKVAIGTQKSLQLAKTPSVFVFVNSSP